MSNYVTIETDDDFDDLVPTIPSDQLVILDFTAAWCGPCKRIGPMVQTLASRLPQIKVIKIDVDECPDTAAKYQVAAMPTFIFIKDGQIIKQFAGANYDMLEEITLRILYPSQ